MTFKRILKIKNGKKEMMMMIDIDSFYFDIYVAVL
jgi:hypothetical protein